MDLDDSISLYLSLINLAIRCYPEQTGYVDSALQYCVNLVEKKQESSYVNKVFMSDHLHSLLFSLSLVSIVAQELVNSS